MILSLCVLLKEDKVDLRKDYFPSVIGTLECCLDPGCTLTEQPAKKNLDWQGHITLGFEGMFHEMVFSFKLVWIALEFFN